MTATIATLCEQIIDQAGELGVRLTRAARDRRRFPVECAIHLRDALAALARAAEALDRQVQAPAPREGQQ